MSAKYVKKTHKKITVSLLNKTTLVPWRNAADAFYTRDVYPLAEMQTIKQKLAERGIESLFTTIENKKFLRVKHGEIRIRD